MFRNHSLAVPHRFALGFGLGWSLLVIGCDEAEEVSPSAVVGPKTADITVTHIGTPTQDPRNCPYPDSHLEGHWVGQYKCSTQGTMMLDVEMARVRSKLMATVTFQPSEHSAESAKEGTWRAEVSYGDNGWMTFEPDEWIKKPDDQHHMLIFRGRVNGESAQKITGPVVDQKSCSNFSLRRVDAHPCTGVLPLQDQTEESSEASSELTGKWVGSTTCDGTLIDLSIAIGPPSEEERVADVYFETSQEGEALLNKGRWTSSVEKKSSSSTVRFVPQDWSAASGEANEKLDISGRLNASATQITGEILNISGCRNLILRRPSYRGP